MQETKIILLTIMILLLGCKTNSNILSYKYKEFDVTVKKYQEGKHKSLLIYTYKIKVYNSKGDLIQKTKTVYDNHCYPHLDTLSMINYLKNKKLFNNYDLLKKIYEFEK